LRERASGELQVLQAFWPGFDALAKQERRLQLAHVQALPRIRESTERSQK